MCVSSIAIGYTNSQTQYSRSKTPETGIHNKKETLDTKALRRIDISKQNHELRPQA